MSTAHGADEVSPARIVGEMITATSGGRIALHPEPFFLRTVSPLPARQVALVSGGGSGHEPMHAGFLGHGGLDAVCPGEVFTSPHSRQIYQGSRAVALPGGVLHLVKNYTGDVINFQIAAERLRHDGVQVGRVLVQDDLGSSEAATGMRGTAATVIVEKLLGAAADAGSGLAELIVLGDRVVANSRSLAVAMAAHHDRETGSPAFALDEGLLEFGVGIHGERARGQLPAEDLTALGRRMTTSVLQALPRRGPLIVLVNGLGGMSNLDLATVAHSVSRVLVEQDVEIESLLFGTYVSALDMQGFSLTCTVAEPDWLPWWYAEHETAALPRPRPFRAAGAATSDHGADRENAQRTGSAWANGFADKMSDWRRAFNALDAVAGDGDFGDNLVRGLRAVTGLAADGATGSDDHDLKADLQALAAAFLDDVGGSSGPLFGILLEAAATSTDQAGGPDDLRITLAAGLVEGTLAITRIGGAEPGDRTMIDALTPLTDGSHTMIDYDTAAASVQSAEATAGMRPRRGRASYLADRVQGVPDAGALAVAALVISLSEQLDRRDHTDLWARLDAVVQASG